MNRRKILLKREEILKEFEVILALEEKAAHTYRQLAEDCNDPQAKAWLEQISKEEFAHRAIAKKLVQLARSASNETNQRKK